MPNKDDQKKTQRKPSPEYISLLERVFLATVCDRRSLYDDITSIQNICKMVKRAIALNHIKESSYKEVYGHRNRTHKYLSITAEGVALLSKWGKSEWTHFLPSDKVNMTTLRDWRARQIAFSVRCGNTFLLADSLGAVYSDFVVSGVPCDTSPLIQAGRKNIVPSTDDEDDEEEEDALSGRYNFFDEEEGDVTTLMNLGILDSEAGEPVVTIADVKSEAYARMEMMIHKERSLEKGEIYFFPIQEIRKMILNDKTPIINQTDFSYGQYTGALFSEKVGLVLYHAKHDGLDWARGAGHRDIKVMQRFSGKYSPFNTIMKGQAFAGVIVYNEKNFADIVINKFEKRKPGVTMGKDFNIMHAIPLSEYGPDFLLRWVLDKTPAERRAYVHEVISSNFDVTYTKDAQLRRYFRYEGDMGLIADGTDMDIMLSISQYKMLTEKRAFNHLTVIGFQWQESFYRHLWDGRAEMGFITIPYPS